MANGHIKTRGHTVKQKNHMPEKNPPGLKQAYKFSRANFVLFAGVFALVGAYFLWQTFAATACLVSNRTGWALGGADCNVGTTINRIDQAFICNQPLSNYGTLPLKVVVDNTGAWSSAGAVMLDGGCSGDGNPDTIDLIVDIRGNGPFSSTGPGEDAFKTRTSPGPQNVQLTGIIECGRQASGAHQDGVQIQGGSNISFVNIKMGNYQSGLSTCQGAGGAFFYSINNPNNVDIYGGEFIACNHGLLGDIGTNHDVIDAKFRAGRNDGSDPNCNFSSGGACTQYAALNMVNVSCGNWNNTTDTWNDTVINPTSPPPAPPPTPPPPTPPPPTPPPPGNCTINDTSGCVPATAITITDTFWQCTQPLSNYGPLPIKVTANFTGPWVPSGGGGAIQLGQGCTGDSNSSSVDLILDVKGDGQTFGSGEDAIRLMNANPGPTNIQITGHADCGKQVADNHSDGIQAISGRDITFVDFTIGDYDAGRATCQGAGGVVFYSGGGGNVPVNLVILRGSYIGCNHALGFNPYNNTGVVVDAKWRSGRNATNGGPAGECLGSDGQPFFTSSPCPSASQLAQMPNFVFTGNTCQQWSTQSGWGNLPPPPPPPPPPPDTTPPTASMTAPANGSTVSGSSVTVSANATDNVAVASVQFRLDGMDLGPLDSAAPYSYVWDTTTLANGPHSLTAIARDAAGNSTTASTVNVTVNNVVAPPPDTTPPSTPTGLSSPSKTTTTISLAWNASTDTGGSGLAGYRVYRNGTLRTSTTQLTYTDTGLTPNTAYSYRVSAYDNASNESAQSAPLSVTTNANPPPSLPPTVTLSANPTTVSREGASTLTWSSSNANSCVASGSWSGSKATSGSQSTGPLTASAVFTLTCTGSGGSANTSVTVTVSGTPSPEPPPRPLIPPRVPPWVILGDLNNDGFVNIFDLAKLLRHYRTNVADADVNDDGKVDIFDLAKLLGRYGKKVQ